MNPATITTTGTSAFAISWLAFLADRTHASGLGDGRAGL
jgi:hypothetical protein